MSRRGSLDLVVVGGGVVGATCALSLAALGLEVALVERRPPLPWRQAEPDLRVYAFAPDNAALLQRLGIWSAVSQARVQPYRGMQVWDAGGGGALRFDADRLGRSALGWIVEHGLLVDRLWAALPGAGVRVHCPAEVTALEREADSVRLRLDDGTRLEARWAVAADGATSAVRSLAGIEVDAYDYGQRGVVAYLSTERPHEDTAWQRFLPSGPLAVLPFVDGTSSIVWTLPEAEAARVLELDAAAFGHAVTQAFGARLGAMSLVSERAAFPLRRQLAQRYCEHGVLVMGDAAHVVHPLAGQGVNLGLRDVSALVDSVQAAQARRIDWGSRHRLARWARARRSHNAVAAHVFEGFNRVFSNERPLETLLRGPLLGWAGRVPPLANAFWRQASGL